MDSKKDVGVTNEIESRLEELFEEGGESPPFVEDGGVPEGFSLRDLKATVLSIDWEITDEMMTNLIEETNRLAQEYKDDKNTLMFLRLLGSAGKYIRTNKANAHPDAIKLLNSVYNGLEKVLLWEGITEAEKKQILLVRMNEFKKLKEQIALRKAGKAEKKGEKPPKEMKPLVERREQDVAVPQEAWPSDMSRMPAHEAFAYALEAIKEVIHAEFRALRAELKLWKEE
jgi:hypothetical protein